MFQSPFSLTRNYQAVENPEQHVYAALRSKLIFSFLSFVRWQYWESCLRSAAPDGRQGATWPTAACPRVQGGCSEKESLQLEHKSAARAPVFPVAEYNASVVQKAGVGVILSLLWCE